MLTDYLSHPYAVRAIALLLIAVTLLFYCRRYRPMRVITVIDGDTYIAVDTKGKKFKLRLRGVDCPEIGQRYAFEARDFVEGLVKSKWVEVRFSGRDRFRRHLVDIRIARASLAKEIVAQGMGFPLPKSGLKMASLGAQLSKKGVWSGLGQSMPWEAKTRNSSVRNLFNKSKRWRKFRKARMERRHYKKNK